MADDAPVDAGTDENAGQETAEPANGRAAGMPSDKAEPADGNGAAAAADPVDAVGAPGRETVAEVGVPASTNGADASPGAGGTGARHAGGAGATGVADLAVPVTGAAGAGAEVDTATAAGDADAASTAGAATSADPPASGRQQRKGGFWRELPVLVVIAVALAVLIRTFLVQAFFIPSGSMEKTLHGCPGCPGDKVLVNKLVYDFRDPRPGDIVVFRGPPSWESEVQVKQPGNPVSRALRWIGQTVGVAQPDEKDFVKRVIAVGGQTVACCDHQGRVTVDGTPLDEPYVYESLPGLKPQEFGPVTVPKGRLWVMGDHRDGSADSRAHIDDGHSGTVPVDDVIGKAFVIVWPPSRWNTLGTPPTFRNVSSGPLGDGVPLGMGLVGALPVVGLRRWRANRRLRSRRPPGPRRPGDRGWWRSRWRAGRR
jgi:signal peptidase I